MPTMVTFHAGKVALVAVLAVLAAGCSREQQDWRSAEGAGTSEAWARFIEQHPDSELAAQARSRIAQLAEARDWQHATSIATADAYREFLAQHPSGKRSEDARIRIEAFALGSAPRIEPPTPAEAAASTSSGVRALHLATAAAPAAPPAQAAAAVAQPAGAVAQPVLAVPGESAQAAPVASDAPTAAVPGGYGVQLGAFGSEASADRAWQRLQGRFGAQLGGLSARIVPASTDTGPLYRLQVAAAGEAQARAICDSLKSQAQPCVPVVPR
jgi:cell division septation protein DedD